MGLTNIQGGDGRIDSDLVHLGGLANDRKFNLGLDHPNLAENLCSFDALDVLQADLVQPRDHARIIHGEGAVLEACVFDCLLQPIDCIDGVSAPIGFHARDENMISLSQRAFAHRPLQAFLHGFGVFSVRIKITPIKRCWV